MQSSTPIAFNVTPDEFIKSYLNLFKGLAELTPKEIDVLEQFIMHQLKFQSDGLSGIYLSKFLFSVDTRKAIQEKLGFSYNQLHNYFIGLIKKNLIKEIEGEYYIDELLIPKQSITFEFNFV
jgi:hypothetical protein